MDKQDAPAVPGIYSGFLPDGRKVFVIVVASNSSQRITVAPRRCKGRGTIPDGGAVVTSDGFTVSGPSADLKAGTMDSKGGHSLEPLAAILPKFAAKQGCKTMNTSRHVAAMQMVEMAAWTESVDAPDDAAISAWMRFRRWLLREFPSLEEVHVGQAQPGSTKVWIIAWRALGTSHDKEEW